MKKGSRWSEDEMIIVLDLYFKLPFGRLNRNTREVKELAALMGRTADTVAIRLTDFASCDPYIINSGRHGMEQGKKRCLPYWNKYANYKESLFSKQPRSVQE